MIPIVTAKDFITQCCIPLHEGWGYIYGTWGIVWTTARQKAATRDMTVRYGSRWIGKKVTDCSGLLRWALNQLGEKIVHHARYQYTEYCTVCVPADAGVVVPVPEKTVFVMDDYEVKGRVLPVFGGSYVIAVAEADD